MESLEQTVCIVDDDEAVRDSLAILCRSVGLTTQTYASALAYLEAHDPDRTGCLVLDVRMPGMSGLQLQKRLEELGSPPPIIFITGHGDVPMAVGAIQRGAVDFIQKPFRDQDLLDRIQQALELDVERRRELHERRELESRLERLTAREREVLDLVVAGHPNKVVAGKLGLSQRTVEIHRSHVMEKMEVESLAELVRFVTELRDS